MFYEGEKSVSREYQSSLIAHSISLPDTRKVKSKITFVSSDANKPNQVIEFEAFRYQTVMHLRRVIHESEMITTKGTIFVLL